MILNDDFTNIQEFETEIKNKDFFNLWLRFQTDGANGFDYKQLSDWQEKFAPFGLTFDYSLDAEPFDFEIN
jgi:hypothetical protein